MLGLRYLYVLALVVWLGGMVVLGAVVAPTTFQVLQASAPANGRALVPTRDHQLHRQRRAVLSRFFSQQNVRRLVPAINATLENLLHRLEGWAEDGSIVSFNAAYKAATKDVIEGYALGEGQRCLEMEDLNASFFQLIAASRLSHVSVHFHWLLDLMAKLPLPVLMVLNPHIGVFAKFVEVWFIKSTSESNLTTADRA